MVENTKKRILKILNTKFAKQIMQPTLNNISMNNEIS
jgi:hypothetical protein